MQPPETVSVAFDLYDSFIRISSLYSVAEQKLPKVPEALAGAVARSLDEVGQTYRLWELTTEGACYALPEPNSVLLRQRLKALQNRTGLLESGIQKREQTPPKRLAGGLIHIEKLLQKTLDEYLRCDDLNRRQLLDLLKSSRQREQSLHELG